MFALLGKLFFTAIGVASGFSALLFALFTITAVSLLIQSWSDQEFSLKDRAWITLLFAAVIAWGSWLTYLAGFYAIHWIHGLA